MGLKDIFADPSKFKFYRGKGYPAPNSVASGQVPLLSIKYGSDQPGGGSSGQPFVQQSIPKGQIPFQATSAGVIDNIVNNAQLNISAVGQDVERIGKWFTTTPGILFIAKQNVLSQTNVRTQANNVAIPRILINGGPYTPTNTLAQVAGINFGSHFYKQGLTPTGFRLPKYGDNEVITAVKGGPVGTENRLVELTRNKIINYYRVGNDNTNILTYPGGPGPGSVLGIGTTNIQFANKGGSAPRVNLYKNTNKGGNLTNNYLVLTYNGIGYLAQGPNTTIGTVVNNEPIIKANQSFSDNNIRNVYNYSPLPQEDFRKTLINNLTGVKQPNGTSNSSIISDTPDYTTQNIEQRVNLGNPGTRGNIISYTTGKILNNSFGKVEALDKITAKPLYRSKLVSDVQTNDLVKFRIEAVDNKEPGFGVFMHFRAFIDSFSDNYTADWTDSQYVGRGEKFYTYNSFTRTINMAWTVTAQSKQELIPMYQKLNFLASNMMPDYSDQGYMRGSLIRLTVGGYLYSQPGFLTSLTYEVPSESPWEIGINDKGGSDTSVKELPHIIRVTAVFTPIHTFVPRKQINEYSGSANTVSSFGKERFVALNDGSNNNYNYTPSPFIPQSNFTDSPSPGNQSNFSNIA